MSPRIARIRQDAVAQISRHESVEAADKLGDALMIRPNLAQVLRVAAILGGPFGAGAIHRVSNFAQTAAVNGRILLGSSHHLKVTPRRNTSGANGGATHHSQCYRYDAAECLLAAQEACPLYHSQGGTPT